MPKQKNPTTVRLLPEQIQQLEAVAAQENISRHKLIRLAVTEFLSNNYSEMQKTA